MIKNSNKLNQKGFTIVELMIATVVFSMVLMVCSYAIIHIGRVYYKGVIIKRTQDAAQLIVEDVARSIQFTRTDLVQETNDAEWGNSAPTSICIGKERFTYQRDGKPQGSGSDDSTHKHVMVRSTRKNAEESCRTNEPKIDDNTIDLELEQLSMLGENMRLSEFKVGCDMNGYCDVKAKVSYGDSEELFEDGTYSACRGIRSSGQFCAVSEYSTSVTGRLP